MIVAPRNAFPTYKDQKRTVDHVTKVGNAGEVHGNDERRGFTRSSLLEGAEKLVAVARNGHTQESRREKIKVVSQLVFIIHWILCQIPTYNMPRM